MNHKRYGPNSFTRGQVQTTPNEGNPSYGTLPGGNTKAFLFSCLLIVGHIQHMNLVCVNETRLIAFIRECQIKGGTSQK